ncbi:hypothetical protein Rhe02_29150 [Rhizocola hellebori]|uniref:Uncharacterized protein n=1 Tax=Rhizocola hellebori TaxID=1392758 RepID=A0A8J3Q6B2_9ACTN|nr:hypothetical protein [Rhizocola hellebori]GIH04848.1 hypothetical protein Rhe02_29150 [Rhizocola hellebori]
MRRWITAVTTMIMLLSASLWVSTPAAAEPNTLTVVSSASYFRNTVSMGSLVSLFTSQPLTGAPDKYFDPWVTDGPGGIYVLANCADEEHFMKLPILYIGRFQVNAYIPNAMGPEPWGTCAYSGPATFVLQPAAGYGTYLVSNLVTVATHPGIFSAGPAPSGKHVAAGAEKDLIDCSNLVPANPALCRTRTGGVPAELILYLTGSEWYLCGSCPPEGLIFELAPVANGVIGAYVPQTLLRLERNSNGLEMARVRLRTDVSPGENRLRVRNSVSPDIPQPLPIWFGLPT